MSHFILPIAQKLSSVKLYFREYKDSSLVDIEEYHWRVVSDGVALVYNLPSTMIVNSYISSSLVTLQYVITSEDTSPLYNEPPSFLLNYQKQLSLPSTFKMTIGYKTSIDAPPAVITDYESIAEGNITAADDGSMTIKGPDRLIEGDTPELIEADRQLKESIRELIYEIKLEGTNYGAAIQSVMTTPGNYTTDFTIDALYKP